MRVRRLINNDMSFGQGAANFAADAETVAQKVQTRLQMLLGEWFLDADFGLPYLQKITAKPTDLAYVEAVIKQCIIETDGVSTLDSFDMSMDNNTRKLVITCSVTTIYGDAIENIKVTR